MKRPDRLEPIWDALVRVTGHDRRSADYADVRRAEDRKQARALRVRRLMDMGELPRVEMERGYE